MSRLLAAERSASTLVPFGQDPGLVGVLHESVNCRLPIRARRRLPAARAGGRAEARVVLLVHPIDRVVGAVDDVRRSGRVHSRVHASLIPLIAAVHGLTQTATRKAAADSLIP